MKIRLSISAALLAAAMFFALAAAAKTGGKKDTPAPASASATANQSDQGTDMRLEGEKRFRANCSRCHTAPPKFPPRMMGTIVRHMRVRATLTDQDMRLILRYMTQ